MLLAYTSGLGKPWAVLDATPLPLRADFNFYPAGEIDRILAWPCAPRSVGHMVLYDATDGAISQRVARIVGQPLGPADPQVAFEQVCGDFWYYALRTWAKLLRRQWPVARHEYAAIMLGNLAALLRLEAGATERWRNSSAMQGIEQAIAPARLAQLERCFADADPADLARAFGAATWLAQDVCGAIGARHSWPWPADLAARVVALSSADT